MKGQAIAFTIKHHCRQQALLLAAQSVMGLALLVPEAGQTLGAGQVLTDCMLHASTQAVCASRSRARRKKKGCISSACGGNSRGTLLLSLLQGGGGRARFPKQPPLLVQTTSGPSQSHTEGMLKGATEKCIQGL
jgi:hypothetical protein